MSLDNPATPSSVRSGPAPAPKKLFDLQVKHRLSVFENPFFLSFILDMFVDVRWKKTPTNFPLHFRHFSVPQVQTQSDEMIPTDHEV